jgi:glycosyltransferase involved in cell wall biosynthesis
VRAHIEYSYTIDPAGWRQRHAAGAVPDCLPYGLDRLAGHGCETLTRPAVPGPLRLLERASRGLTGGFEFVQAALDRERRGCDVALCWDERTGVPACLRSSLPGEPPAATGVIWLTEPNAPVGRWGRSLALRALRRAQAIWALSPAQHDPLVRDWGVDRGRLHLLHFGIDAEFWYSGSEGEPDLVLCAGSDRHRDHRLLVEAMRRLHRQVPSLRLELVTQHPVDVPAELGRRHHSLTHPEMRSAYSRASVVALALKPNRHLSGLSVLLEAMACSRPVVITDSPGLREYVSDGETGVVVQAGDPDALAAGVGELLADPARACAIGVAARAAVMERFTTERQAGRIAEILGGIG